MFVGVVFIYLHWIGELTQHCPDTPMKLSDCVEPPRKPVFVGSGSQVEGVERGAIGADRSDATVGVHETTLLRATQGKFKVAKHRPSFKGMKVAFTAVAAARRCVSPIADAEKVGDVDAMLFYGCRICSALEMLEKPSRQIQELLEREAFDGHLVSNSLFPQMVLTVAALTVVGRVIEVVDTELAKGAPEPDHESDAADSDAEPEVTFCQSQFSFRRQQLDYSSTIDGDSSLPRHFSELSLSGGDQKRRCLVWV